MIRIAVRILKVVALVTITACALVAGLGFIMVRHFNTPPPAAHYPKPATDLEAQRQDLAHFRKLVALDRSFEPAARAAAERRIAALEATGVAVDRAHFRVALMEILALADNGHTRLDVGDGVHTKQLPVRVGVFSDGLYVMRATGAGLALLGGQVTAIDGKPIELVMERLAALRGGTTDWRRLHAALYLSDPEILFGTDISADGEHSVWTVSTSNGGTTTTILDAITRSDAEPFVFTDRWVSDAPVKGMGDRWVAVQSDRRQPLSLRDFDTPFRRIRLEQSCTMLIQLKANHDVGDQHIDDFVAATEADMQTNAPCAVILDLRYDGGGNYQNTAAFAKALPDLTQPRGRLFLLTGPATFSAGITTAAFLAQAGGDRVTILGEPVGDRLHFFSEGNRGCLPNRPLCVSYEQGKHDYAHPCTNWDICFWLNKLYPVQVDSLEPHERLPMSFPQWREGRDPAFERAVELAARSD
jgi:hypothetical protein